ncbi:hypothetical protein BJ138DRAFT_977014, partial [Hygrophoropsis aurantiaca]
CLPGTRLRILKEIPNWANQTTDARSIFWLCGTGWDGKSAIAPIVADEYNRKHRLAASLFFSK